MTSDHKEILEDTLISCLENISEISNIQKHKQAALVFYKLLQLAEQRLDKIFLNKLKSNESLEILKFNPYFSGYFSVQLVEHENMK